MSEVADQEAKNLTCPECMATYRGGFETCPVDGTTLTPADIDPLLGQTIADQYVVDRCVGEGAMGRVYLAHHARLKKRKFAMKVLLGDLAADPTMRLRFAQEAEAASRLQHPNVVPVLDFGKTDGELHYLVMDFIEGGNLNDRIQKGAISEKESIEIAIQICQGLTHAHDQGLVHRDFKPDNVALVQRDGKSIPLILDFGLAIISTPEESSVRLTSAGLVVGTPAYVSPEQCQGRPVDLGTDLFAFGVSLYEMVSGVLPFDGSIIELLYKNAMEQAPSIQERSGVKVSPALEAIIMRLMAKDRAERFADARAVMEALEAIDAPAEAVSRVTGAVLSQQAPVDKEKIESAKTMVASTQIDSEPLVVVGAASTMAAAPELKVASEPGAKAGSKGPVIGVAIALVGAAAIAAFVLLGGSNQVEPASEEPLAVVSDESAQEDTTTPVTAPEDTVDPTPPDTPIVDESDVPVEVAEDVKEAKEKPKDRRETKRDRSKKDPVKTAVAVKIAEEKVEIAPPPPPPERDKPDNTMTPEVKTKVEKHKVEKHKVEKHKVVKARMPTSFKVGLSFSKYKISGSGSARVAKAAVHRAKKALQACYEPAARANKKNATVKIRVTLVFDEGGRARNVKVSSGKSLLGVAACVKSKANKLRLQTPPDTGTQKVSFVVKYSPKQ